MADYYRSKTTGSKANRSSLQRNSNDDDEEEIQQQQQRQHRHDSTAERRASLRQSTLMATKSVRLSVSGDGNSDLKSQLLKNRASRFGTRRFSGIDLEDSPETSAHSTPMKGGRRKSSISGLVLSPAGAADLAGEGHSSPTSLNEAKNNLKMGGFIQNSPHFTERYNGSPRTSGEGGGGGGGGRAGSLGQLRQTMSMREMGRTAPAGREVKREGKTSLISPTGSTKRAKAGQATLLARASGGAEGEKGEPSRLLEKSATSMRGSLVGRKKSLNDGDADQKLAPNNTLTRTKTFKSRVSDNDKSFKGDSSSPGGAYRRTLSLTEHTRAQNESSPTTKKPSFLQKVMKRHGNSVEEEEGSLKLSLEEFFVEELNHDEIIAIFSQLSRRGLSSIREQLRDLFYFSKEEMQDSFNSHYSIFLKVLEDVQSLHGRLTDVGRHLGHLNTIVREEKVSKEEKEEDGDSHSQLAPFSNTRGRSISNGTNENEAVDRLQQLEAYLEEFEMVVSEQNHANAARIAKIIQVDIQGMAFSENDFMQKKRAEYSNIFEQEFSQYKNSLRSTLHDFFGDKEAIKTVVDALVEVEGVNSAQTCILGSYSIRVERILSRVTKKRLFMWEDTLRSISEALTNVSKLIIVGMKTSMEIFGGSVHLCSNAYLWARKEVKKVFAICRREIIGQLSNMTQVLQFLAKMVEKLYYFDENGLYLAHEFGVIVTDVIHPSISHHVQAIIADNFLHSKLVAANASFSANVVAVKDAVASKFRFQVSSRMLDAMLITIEHIDFWIKKYEVLSFFPQIFMDILQQRSRQLIGVCLLVTEPGTDMAQIQTLSSDMIGLDVLLDISHLIAGMLSISDLIIADSDPETNPRAAYEAVRRASTFDTCKQKILKGLARMWATSMIEGNVVLALDGFTYLIDSEDSNEYDSEFMAEGVSVWVKQVHHVIVQIGSALQQLDEVERKECGFIQITFLQSLLTFLLDHKCWSEILATKMMCDEGTATFGNIGLMTLVFDVNVLSHTVLNLFQPSIEEMESFQTSKDKLENACRAMISKVNSIYLDMNETAPDAELEEKAKRAAAAVQLL